jgi:hypothetical protein
MVDGRVRRLLCVLTGAFTVENRWVNRGESLLDVPSGPHVGREQVMQS